MIKIGNYNSLKVEKFVDFGLYLLNEGPSILLPQKYIPEGVKVGDMMDVFIYTDSEDRIIATTLKPLAIVGEFAALRVKDVNKFGAFMDWGLEKDLFVPFNEQQKKMEVGKTYVVKILLDPRTNRVVGTSKLFSLFEKRNIELKEGEEVNILIYDQTDLGYQAIINNRYTGVIYYNEIFKPISIGDSLKGFIKTIRPDNKIDLTINKVNKESMDEAKNAIVEELKRNKGFLALNDNSDPEEIKRRLEMSKKTFKKAIGGLYKERQINITPKGIELIEKK